MAFLNHVSKAPRAVRSATSGKENGRAPAPDPSLVRAQVNEILGELLGPLAAEAVDSREKAEEAEGAAGVRG